MFVASDLTAKNDSAETRLEVGALRSCVRDFALRRTMAWDELSSGSGEHTVDEQVGATSARGIVQHVERRRGSGLEIARLKKAPHIFGPSFMAAMRPLRQPFSALTFACAVAGSCHAAQPAISPTPLCKPPNKDQATPKQPMAIRYVSVGRGAPKQH